MAYCVHCGVKLEDGEKELEQAKQDLARAKQEIADGWAELEEAKAVIAANGTENLLTAVSRVNILISVFFSATYE